MANQIQRAREEVQRCCEAAYARAVAAGTLPGDVTLQGSVDSPKDPKNGDFASSAPLAAAKLMKKKPREVAEALLQEMELKDSIFSAVEIAGPGFLNFRLGTRFYAEVLESVETEGENYGAINLGRGERIMVEFVSANPTGTMTIGNARGGVLGDSVAAILEKAGYSVWREFYVNDAGNQVEKFAESLEARYLQMIQGEAAVSFPEDGYHGEDIKALARRFYEEHGDSFVARSSEERREMMKSYGLSYNIRKMQEDLARYNIHYDRWFLESELHESGYVEETVALLAAHGHTYEKDGALWLDNIALGADKDEVLRRANGLYTYYAVDIAYHRNKFCERGFVRVIDVLGADHHGHAQRFAAREKAP